MKQTLMILAVALALSCMAQAQDTYTDTNLMACVGAGHSFTWNASETGCPANGPADTLTDASGNAVQVRFSLYTNAIQLESFDASGQLVWAGTGPVTKVVFTNPSGCTYQAGQPCTTPGHMAFNWSLVDGDGNPHSGTYSTPWDSRAVFRWIRQVLIAQTLIINN